MLIGIGCQKQSIGQIVIGGIVAHHDLVQSEIRSFWQTISQKADFQTIILVGPDHYSAATAPFSSTNNASVFKSPLNLNLKMITKLTAVKNSPIIINDQIFNKEHSIQIHLPYIKQYLPEAKIIPIIIHPDVTRKQISDLVQIIQESLTDNTAIIASVDFSHYENKQQADRYDLETIEVLQNYDYNKLYSFGPEHLDCKQAIMLSSELACPQHNCPWQILFKGNSAEFPTQNSQITTSYYSLILIPE